jgi:hypothetical protein
MNLGLDTKMIWIIVQESNTTSVNSSADYRRLKDIAVAISLTARRRTTPFSLKNYSSKLISPLSSQDDRVRKHININLQYVK